MSEMTRRTLLAGAGMAAGAAAAPAGAAAATPHVVGVVREARTAIDVIGSILQDVDALTGFGYLMHIAGLRDADLFTGDTRTESTAHFTFHSTATVTARNLRPGLFAVIATGQLAFFHHPQGGADFANPDSFAQGTRIATFSARYENTMSIVAADQSVVSTAGALHQRSAPAFRAGGRRCRLGHRGLDYRLSVSGPGRRTNVSPPRASFDVAGTLIVPR